MKRFNARWNKAVARAQKRRGKRSILVLPQSATESMTRFVKVTAQTLARHWSDSREDRWSDALSLEPTNTCGVVP
jgi:hypothetical protein